MNTTSGNIVYLYSEVMPYVITIMKALRDDFNVNIHCISWDKKRETPFSPHNLEKIAFYKRSDYDVATLKKFIDAHTPLIVYVSGRMDKGYMQAVLHARGKGIPVMTSCDNQWYGTIKNKIGALLGYQLYRRYFNYITVAGRRQYEFAKRVGYENSNIISNMLTADVTLFKKGFHLRKEKQNSYPRTIVFVGRFVPLKNIDLLINAFKSVNAELNKSWTLLLVGSGELSYQSNSEDNIVVKDFMSAQQLSENSSEWGVFCLPSYFEGFGVVVHEFAAAGMPLICSDSVGAADTFVIDGYNGYTFRNRSLESLKDKLRRIMEKTDEELWLMGDRSAELANFITPQKSAYYIMSVLDKEK